MSGCAYLSQTGLCAATDKWLQNFECRIAVQWTVLLITAVIAVLISIATVSFQAIKAAVANPVKSLRTE